MRGRSARPEAASIALRSVRGANLSIVDRDHLRQAGDVVHRESERAWPRLGRLEP
jgi:hypothetical protein